MAYQVVLVDDEQLLRNGLQDLIRWDELDLSPAGSFADGERAWAYIRENPVDIVISDIRMPHMDGLTLLRSIGELERDIKVVLLTGFAEFSYAQQALKFGAYDYLIKPVAKEELNRVLGKLKEKLDLRHRALYSRENEEVLFREQIEAALYAQENSQAIPAEHIDLTGRIVRCAEMILVIDMMEDQILLHDNLMPRLKRMLSGQSKLAQRLAHYQIRSLLIENTYSTYTFFSYTESEEGQLNEETIRLLAADLLDLCGEQLTNCGVTIVLGGIHSDIKSVRGDQRRMEQILNMRHLTGINRVLDIREDYQPVIGAAEQNEYEYDEKELLEHLKNGMVEETERDITALYDRILGGDMYMPLSKVRDLSMEIVLTIFRLPQKEQENRSFLFFLNQIRQQPTVEDMRTLVLNLALQVAGSYREQYQDNQTRLVEEALRYIDKHYSDPGLSLEEVSESLHISTTYLSVLLKRLKGRNFLSFLLEKRMESAKQLLRRKDILLMDVAELVGYSSAQYFSISFKKYTGKTPSQYREEASG